MSNTRSSQLFDQTGRNIDLALQLLDEAIEDDAVFDAIPDGGTLILLPYDDPRLALRNLAMALRAANAGQVIYLRRVGAPPARNDNPNVWQSALLNLRLAVSLGFPVQLSIEYDPIADAQVFDFSAGRRSTYRLHISTDVALLIDFDSLEVVGYSVPQELVEHLGPISQEATGIFDSNREDLNNDRSSASAAFVDDLALAA
jgi:hypothetical protein